jgi:hypothetical protein
MPRGGSAPGERRGGRQRGTPNKLTGDVRAMILGALEDAGGRAYLTHQAHQNPTAFLSLIGKVLPLQVAGDNSGRLQVEFSWKGDPEPATINGHAAEAEPDEPPAIDAAAEDAGGYVVVWQGEPTEAAD